MAEPIAVTAGTLWDLIPCPMGSTQVPAASSPSSSSAAAAAALGGPKPGPLGNSSVPGAPVHSGAEARGILSRCSPFNPPLSGDRAGFVRAAGSPARRSAGGGTGGTQIEPLLSASFTRGCLFAGSFFLGSFFFYWVGGHEVTLGTLGRSPSISERCGTAGVSPPRPPARPRSTAGTPEKKKAAPWARTEPPQHPKKPPMSALSPCVPWCPHHRGVLVSPRALGGARGRVPTPWRWHRGDLGAAPGWAGDCAPPAPPIVPPWPLWAPPSPIITPVTSRR